MIDKYEYHNAEVRTGTLWAQFGVTRDWGHMESTGLLF